MSKFVALPFVWDEDFLITIISGILIKHKLDPWWYDKDHVKQLSWRLPLPKNNIYRTSDSIVYNV